MIPFERPQKYSRSVIRYSLRDRADEENETHDQADMAFLHEK